MSPCCADSAIKETQCGSDVITGGVYLLGLLERETALSWKRLKHSHELVILQLRHVLRNHFIPSGTTSFSRFPAARDMTSPFRNVQHLEKKTNIVGGVGLRRIRLFGTSSPTDR